MKKMGLIRSTVTLFTVLGLTLPAGLATAETINSEAGSNQVSSVSSTSASKTSSVVSAQTIETTSSTDSTTEGSPQASEASKSATTVPIQMLGINDFHGALSTTGSYYDAAGNKTSNAGTAALLAGYFNQAEASFKQQNTEGKTIRVQSGDMVGASPANSGLLQDQPTMRILNQMNFAVGTLGNHEFDEGLGEFNRILTGAKPDAGSGFLPIVTEYNNAIPQDELKGGFDLVIANVRKSDNSIPYGWEPYVVKEIDNGAGDPIKIGFIGVVTTEIPNLVLAEHHKEYTFTDPATEIVKYSKELVGKGVNAIVVLGHTPSVQSGEGVTGESADIMNRVNQADPNNSVDAFFAGHNHVYTNGVVGNTRIVQSTSQGKGYIDLQGEYDTEKKDFVETPKATVAPVDPNGGVTKDNAIEAIVADADARVAQVTEEKIGTADKAEVISRTVNEMGESPVGNLVTDAQVYMANKNGVPVDFAMTNNGGIRDDLKVKSDASITWGAAQAVQPFGNIMQIVEMTGQQIENVLNQQTFKFDPNDGRGSGYFLQVSGLKYTVIENPDKSDTEHQYIVKEMKKADGTAIEADKTYKLIINDFLYGGGDGFSEFTNATLTGALDPDTETFIGYIKDLEAKGEKVSAAIDGRKTLAATDPAAEETEKIKAETKLDKYREGDKNITGKTIPNGTITITPAKARALAQGKADKDGNINIAVDQLGLKEGQSATVSIEGENGGKAEFSVTVLPMETTSTTTDTTSATTDTTTETTSTTTDTTSTTTGTTSTTTDTTDTTTDTTSGTTEPTTSSTADPIAEESKLIKAKTKLSKIYDDDAFLFGVTIPNATVEVAVAEDKSNEKSESASAVKISTQAEAPQKSDAKGNFTIDIQHLKLQAGQELIVTVTGANGGAGTFRTTVLAAADRDPAAYAETEKIKKETKLDNVYEGDTRLTGKTIASAAVSLSIDDGVRWVEGRSDENGNINLDITELNLKLNQKFIVTITGLNGGQVDFPMTVLKHEIVSGNNGGLTGGDSTNQNWIDQVWNKVYPNTGEGKQPIFVLLGVVALGASGLLYFKRR